MLYLMLNSKFVKVNITISGINYFLIMGIIFVKNHFFDKVYLL